MGPRSFVMAKPLVGPGVVTVTRKPGTHALSIRTDSTVSSSPTASLADFDARDVKMAMTDCQPQPLTVSIPKNIPSPQCRKPNLQEILSNTAPPPYTLTSFMAFLSQNHCLENLEFTMDASRYRKHYSKMVNRHPGSPVSPLSEECGYVLMLWRRLIDAYIRESGPREVNLPAEVRDNLLSLSDSYVPPHPSSLDSAVAKINELMEESVLVSFLNSVSPQSAHPALGHDSYAGSNISRSSTRSYEERSMLSRSSQPPVPAHQRASAPSSLTSGFMASRPFSHSRFHSQPTSSGQAHTRVTSGYTSGSDALTDDSGSASSPSGMSDPLTPPGTPPMSDYPMADFHQAYYDTGSNSGTPSPRNSRGEHNGLASATRDSWKRVSSKLWPKKKSGGQLRDDEPGVVEGGLF
ncbi:RGS domain-containing protein [Alternaria rosae]|uniref:RGS domain-containing protein n=1 Tax=Alternaria rosae TaxID=1187941 RepID=UPI001E8D3799|nr:RGS domain-containing protein [Alternaria rosae]KAH6875422.1 RGS domain-containing protein [Alternaria rosae]